MMCDYVIDLQELECFFACLVYFKNGIFKSCMPCLTKIYVMIVEAYSLKVALPSYLV